MEKVQHVEQFGVKKGYSVKQTLKFLVPSLIGVLLFLVPLSGRNGNDRPWCYG